MPINRYGDAKEHQGKTYRGMNVGGQHRWTYPDGEWVEGKVTPQRWRVAFTSLKRRKRRAPTGSGAETGSGYHWLIVGRQWVEKLDANTYATHLEGTKHLVSFKKPGWRGWTTQQKGHKSARLKSIAVLEELLAELKAMPDDGRFEEPEDAGALARSAATAEAPVGEVEGAKAGTKAKAARPRRTRPRTHGIKPRRATPAAPATPTRPSSRR